MSQAVLEVKDIKTINDSQSVSFIANAGEIICLFGMNGSGKTLLLKTICGIFKPLEGVVISHINNSERGVCLQFPEHLVFNETAFSEAKLLTGGNEDKAHLLLNEIGAEEDQSPFFMSDGQKRLLFLYGFLSEKNLLIFDEPFASLDPVTRQQVAKKIKAAGELGKTVIYTANRLNDTKWADKVITITKASVAKLF